MITAKYDQQHDVLYVKDSLGRVRFSQEHPIDGDLVLNYDRDEKVVGVQLLNAALVRGMWHAHPGRRCLPAPIRDEVDRVVAWLDSGPNDPEQCAARNVPPRWLLTNVA